MKIINKTFHSIKNEIKREKCTLDHTSPDDFIKSQWQMRTKSFMYLLYRWLIGFFFTFAIILSMVDSYNCSQFGFFFIYLTNWGILFCFVTNVLAAILVTIWHFHPEYADYLLTFKTLTCPIRVYWSLHVISLVLSLVITIVYWSVLYDSTTSILTSVNIITHAVNSVCMFIDLLIVAHPLRLLHIYLPLTVGLIYAIFSIIYQTCGGKNMEGDPYIYRVIDWRDPLNASLTIIGVLILTCALYMLLFIIYKLRIIIYRRVHKSNFPIKNSNTINHITNNSNEYQIQIQTVGTM